MEEKPVKKQLTKPTVLSLPKEFFSIEKGTEGRLTFTSSPRSSESYSDRSSSFSESSSIDYSTPRAREGTLEVSGPVPYRKKQRMQVDPRALEVLKAQLLCDEIFNGTGKPVPFVVPYYERAENGVMIRTILHGVIPAAWGKPYTCMINKKFEDGNSAQLVEKREGDEICKCHVLEHRVPLADNSKYAIWHIYDEKTKRVAQYDILRQKISNLPEDRIPGYNGFMDLIEEFPIFPESQESRNIIILVPRYTANYLFRTACSHRFVTYFPLDENKSLNVIVPVEGAAYALAYTPIPKEIDPVNIDELRGKQ